ncbi:hypothetical protein V1477_000287 [Vespula maculifrons]|uniref:Uncharacterized protein n=1 Tax=Vespula maculifrons TaxID=7453 RepID=A0ABD2D2H2_VESMC
MRRLRRLRCQIAVLWKFFAVESTSNALNNIPQASELFYKIALPMEGHVIIDDLFILSDPFRLVDVAGVVILLPSPQVTPNTTDGKIGPSLHQERSSFCLVSPHLISPHHTSPHLTSPHLTSPHLTAHHHEASRHPLNYIPDSPRSAYEKSLLPRANITSYAPHNTRHRDASHPTVMLYEFRALYTLISATREAGLLRGVVEEEKEEEEHCGRRVTTPKGWIEALPSRIDTYRVLVLF